MKNLSSKKVFLIVLVLSALTSLLTLGPNNLDQNLKLYKILVLIPGVFTLIYAFRYFTNITGESVLKDYRFFRLLSLVTLSLILFPNILLLVFRV